MFDNVVVGVDGRQGGQDAVALARVLASPTAKLTLAHVYGGHSAGGRLSALAMPVELDAAQGIVASAASDAGARAETAVIYESSVGRGLHELAEQRGADVLLVGSSRRALLGRVLLGDDTHAALNGAPCAVAIAPAGYGQEAAAIREIGVAYNGSPESEYALDVARELAQAHGARLSAFEAVSLPAYLFMGTPAPVDLSIEDAVKAAHARITALGDVEAHAAYGRPSEELAVYSASLGLLVAGSRGYGPLARLVHGSTSQQLARTARCPLLVLTRAGRTIPAA